MPPELASFSSRDLTERAHLLPIQDGAHRDVAGARVDAKLLLGITTYNGVENEVIWRPVVVHSSYLKQMHNE